MGFPLLPWWVLFASMCGLPTYPYEDVKLICWWPPSTHSKEILWREQHRWYLMMVRG